jgi:hypothetical protein
MGVFSQRLCTAIAAVSRRSGQIHKIVLLTSCNTVIDIQDLAYAVMKWPTVFRSQVVCTKSSHGIVGPCIKGVTPVENFVQMAMHRFPVPNAGGAVNATPGQEPSKGQALKSTINPASVPSRAGAKTLVEAPPTMPGSSRAWRERRHKSKQQRVNSIHNGDAHLKIPGECGEEAGCAA